MVARPYLGHPGNLKHNGTINNKNEAPWQQPQGQRSQLQTTTNTMTTQTSVCYSISTDLWTAFATLELYETASLTCSPLLIMSLYLVLIISSLLVILHHLFASLLFSSPLLPCFLILLTLTSVLFLLSALFDLLSSLLTSSPFFSCHRSCLSHIFRTKNGTVLKADGCVPKFVVIPPPRGLPSISSIRETGLQDTLQSSAPYH